MLRRIFFLLPDKKHIGNVVKDLSYQGVQRSQMLIVSGKSKDPIYELEKRLWTGNIVLFFISLFAAVFIFALELYFYIIPLLAIMIVCLTLGTLFAIKTPNVHISDFNSAMKHGEVLLVVDSRKQQVHSIIHHLNRKHPEVTTGGVGWTFSR